MDATGPEANTSLRRRLTLSIGRREPVNPIGDDVRTGTLVTVFAWRNQRSRNRLGWSDMGPTTGHWTAYVLTGSGRWSAPPLRSPCSLVLEQERSVGRRFFIALSFFSLLLHCTRALPQHRGEAEWPGDHQARRRAKRERARSPLLGSSRAGVGTCQHVSWR